MLIYMPLIPEAIVAMLATNRIGAIHSVVFGGMFFEVRIYLTVFNILYSNMYNLRYLICHEYGTSKYEFGNTMILI